MDAQTHTAHPAPRRRIPSRAERLGLTGNCARVSQQAVIMADVFWPEAGSSAVWYERASHAFHGACFMVKTGSADDLFLSWLCEAAEAVRLDLRIKEIDAR